MYFGSVNIFRPLVSAKIYEIFKPTSILDFGGVGRKNGRGDGVERQEIHGIDNNKNYKKPYKDMVVIKTPHRHPR
jgi:hypothetical protein